MPTPLIIMSCFFIFMVIVTWLLPKYFSIDQAEIPEKEKKKGHHQLTETSKKYGNIISCLFIILILGTLGFEFFAPDDSIMTFEGQKYGADNVVFSPNGKSLASYSWSGAKYIWSAETGEIEFEIETESLSVKSLDISPDSKILIAGTSENNVTLWSMETGKLLNTLEGHTGDVLSATFSPDGSTILSGGMDQTLRFWSSETLEEVKCIEEFSNRISDITFNQQGDILAFKEGKNTVYLWSVTDEKVLFKIIPHEKITHCLDLSSDGTMLATGGDNKKIKIWSAQSGEEMRTIKTGISVNDVKFSPNGKMLASGGKSGYWSLDLYGATLYSPETGKRLRKLKGKMESVNSISFSADGNSIVCAGGQ